MKYVKGLLIQLSFIGVAYGALFENIEGFRNLLLVFVWGSLALFIMFLNSDNVCKAVASNEKIKSVIPGMGWLMFIALVWFGWFWTSGGFAFLVLLQEVVKDKGKKLIAAEEQKNG